MKKGLDFLMNKLHKAPPTTSTILSSLYERKSSQQQTKAGSNPGGTASPDLSALLSQLAASGGQQPQGNEQAEQSPQG